MRRSDLGEFEEIVLLAVAALSTGAYSVVIAEELEKETGQKVVSKQNNLELTQKKKKIENK